jgi:electron transport complex protein RnfB
MNDTREIYARLIDWLKKMWWDLPEADELVPLMMERYTPEEALLLTGTPFSPHTVEELAHLKGMNPEDLAPALEAMARKGILFRVAQGETIFYRINDTMLVYLRTTFWPGGTDETTTRMAPLVNRYFRNGFFDQYKDVHVKGLRALPIEETIEDTRQILPYEDVVRVVDTQDYFCVTHCPCRHRKNIDPTAPDCEYSTENCLHFGTLARYIVENGLGREITREETHEILRRAADEGLVHGVSNWLKGVDTICSCCKCCCMWFEAFHVLKHDKSMDSSNYRVKTTAATCKACGLCVTRCPMDALRLVESDEATNKKEMAAVLDPELCIGCGVCVHKCPTESLVLEHREIVVDPPRDPREYTKLFFSERTVGRMRREQKG